MQADYFAVPIAAPPAGLVQVGSEPGPAGQVFQVWQGGEHQYLSVLVDGREKWFYMAATSGRETPRWN